MPTHHLLLGFSLWGLEGLHSPASDGIARVGSAGYHTLESNVWGFTDEVVSALTRSGLRPVFQCYPLQIDKDQAGFARAKQIGAVLMNAHAGTSTMSQEEAITLVNGLIDIAEQEGIELLFETHRGRLTQDLYRTSQLVRLVPRMKLTLDVSHFVLSEEKYGPVPELANLFDPILDRVEMIHGRISNGEQIQVDVGDGQGELPQLYKRFWAEAMRRWRLRNKPGRTLIFTPELGPPGYALTSPDGKEFTDRWAQSLVLRTLAQEAWEMSAGGTSCWP